MKRVLKIFLLFFIFISIFSFFVCNKKEGEKDFHKKPLSPELQQWRKNLLEKRAKEDEEFKKSPTSPIAGLDRLTASPEKVNYVLFENGHFELSERGKDSALISVFKKASKWYLKIFDNNFVCKEKGNIIESGSSLEDDLKCRYDRYSFLVYPLDSSLVLVSFDPEKKEVKEFKHRFYYPPNPDYRVKAKLIRLRDKEKVKMITSQNLIKTFYRYARIDFEIKGEKKHLFAYKKDLSKKPGEAYLFIPFKDRTNGKTTYGAGRFLEIKEPVGDSFILDFNEAFNPLCNYSHVWNCSYPPSENILDIPIEAGEKIYPISH